MREQMPHGRALRAGRLVEVDGALLGGDERRQRGDELRHRRPAEDVVARPVRRDLLAAAHDAGRGRVGAGQASICTERLHGRRY